MVNSCMHRSFFFAAVSRGRGRRGVAIPEGGGAPGGPPSDEYYTAPSEAPSSSPPRGRAADDDDDLQKDMEKMNMVE